LPFISEEIYQGITGTDFLKKKSVHLEAWPELGGKSIDKKLNEDMEKARELVTLALAQRAKSQIKVRQPLASLQIQNTKDKIQNELLDLIKDEINVKSIIFGDSLKLDTNITPELKEEGMIREVVRNIQEMRKKSNLKPKNNISVRYSGETSLVETLEKNEKVILKEGKIKDFLSGKDLKGFKIQQEIKIGDKNLLLAIKKIK
jgi:isoleucyl-tRNA synthetase